MLTSQSIKKLIKLSLGALSLLLGLCLFIYYGTRSRSAPVVDPERQKQILTHDILTFSGLALIFAGLFLLIVTAARQWKAADSH